MNACADCDEVGRGSGTGDDNSGNAVQYGEEWDGTPLSPTTSDVRRTCN